LYCLGAPISGIFASSRKLVSAASRKRKAISSLLLGEVNRDLRQVLDRLRILVNALLGTAAPAPLQPLGDVGAKLHPVLLGQGRRRATLHAFEEQALESLLGLALLVATDQLAQVCAGVPPAGGSAKEIRVTVAKGMFKSDVGRDIAKGLKVAVGAKYDVHQYDPEKVKVEGASGAT
jgi:hypothetical protein